MKNCTSFAEQKRYTVYSGKRLIWHYCLQLSFFYKTMSRISINLCRSGNQRHLLDFMRKWGWFHGHVARFPKSLGSRLKFQKTEIWFCRWKSNGYSDINMFLSMKTLCSFLLAKERTWRRIFITHSELSQNHREEQFIPFKTTVNWFIWLENWYFLKNSCNKGDRLQGSDLVKKFFFKIVKILVTVLLKMEVFTWIFHLLIKTPLF